MIYNPKNELHFDVIKGFHQSLVDDRYPPADNRYFVQHLLPGVMAELERLKGEVRRLELENEDLRNEADVAGLSRQTGSTGPG